MAAHFKFDQFFNSCSIPMILWSDSLTLVAINAGAEKILGAKQSDLSGKSLKEVSTIGCVGFDLFKFNSMLQGVLDNCSVQHTCVKEDGSVENGGIHSSIFTISQKQYILSVFQKSKEHSSEENEQISQNNLIKKLMSLNPDVHYILDLKSRSNIYESQDMLNFFGYTLEDIGTTPMTDFLIGKIDPSTLKEVALASKSLKADKSVGEFVEVEYRIMTKEKGWKWVSAKSTPLIQTPDEIVLTYGIIQDISEKKAIEEQIRTNEALISEVATLVPDSIVVYNIHSFECIYTNVDQELLSDIIDVTWPKKPKEKVKINLEDYFKSTTRHVAKFNEGEIFHEEISYTKASTGGDDIKWALVRAKIFHLDAEGKPQHILFVLTQITNFKQTESLLNDSIRTNQSILEAIPDLLMVIDDEGIYKRVFEGVSFQVSEEESIVGKSIFDRLSKINANGLLQKIRTCIETGEMQSFEFIHEFPGEQPFAYYSSFITKLNDREANVLARDITESFKLKISVEEKLVQLADKNRELETFITKNSELERFSYILSHDLKEPIRMNQSLVELIEMELETTANPVISKLLQQLIRNNIRMEEMIFGVLEYSKLQHKVVFQQLSLDDIVKEVALDLEITLAKRNVELAIEPLGKIQGDKTQLRQLFQNLISNAIKFNVKERPRIKISKKLVDGDTIFRVSDNGIGIHDDFKKSIFTMFKRVHSENAYSGHGIGLSLCKKIVEQHNGKIWIEDNAGGGAVFCFQFNMDT
jgi:signal transduction histidine kinase